jgi:hypothetical protein
MAAASVASMALMPMDAQAVFGEFPFTVSVPIN